MVSLVEADAICRLVKNDIQLCLRLKSAEFLQVMKKRNSLKLV